MRDSSSTWNAARADARASAADAQTVRRAGGRHEALWQQVIVAANIGCIQHLQSGTTLPVRHWVEVVDEALD